MVQRTRPMPAETAPGSPRRPHPYSPTRSSLSCFLPIGASTSHVPAHCTKHTSNRPNLTNQPWLLTHPTTVHSLTLAASHTHLVARCHSVTSAPTSRYCFSSVSAMALQRIVVWMLLACVSVPAMTPVRGHNITAILDGYPEYALYNKYLTETKVCDEINARESVTCLVLPDGAMSTLVSDAKESLAGIKNALRLLALLDYFDPQKLHGLPSGSTLTTTLYQTTGDAAGNLGSVNITNLRGGRVGFASATEGAKFDAMYTKAVKQMPFNLSIVEISAPIEFPGLFDSPSTANLTKILEKAGCKQFAGLIASTGVLKMYQAEMDKGLTLFAPNDDAFAAKGAPDVKKMSSADLVTLLQYHALPEYNPKASLKAASGPMRTLASSAAGKYDISVVAHGDDVALDTGVDKSRVASTVLDNTPVCVLTVDSLLLPAELFGGAPAPAPGPAALTPAPAPLLAMEAPLMSPPAPPPADAPSKPADHKKNLKASSGVAVGSAGASVAAVCSVVLAFLS